MLSKLFNQFKCSTMMLPEHVEALTEHQEEKKKTAELYVPEIDQQQLEEWEWLLNQSLDKKTSVQITFILQKKRNTVTGLVESINPNKRTIILRTADE